MYNFSFQSYQRSPLLSIAFFEILLIQYNDYTFCKNGNIIYIREKSINNLAFIDYINSNEKDFSNLNNEDILSIENNIINKYKEIFNE